MAYIWKSAYRSRRKSIVRRYVTIWSFKSLIYKILAYRRLICNLTTSWRNIIRWIRWIITSLFKIWWNIHYSTWNRIIIGCWRTPSEINISVIKSCSILRVTIRIDLNPSSLLDILYYLRFSSSEKFLILLNGTNRIYLEPVF